MDDKLYDCLEKSGVRKDVIDQLIDDEVSKHVKRSTNLN